MTITKKPPNIEALINKGGSVPKEYNNKSRKNLILKLRNQTLNDIKKLISKRQIRINRQQWLEEAVLEKIEKDNLGYDVDI